MAAELAKATSSPLIGHVSGHGISDVHHRSRRASNCKVPSQGCISDLCQDLVGGQQGGGYMQADFQLVKQTLDFGLSHILQEEFSQGDKAGKKAALHSCAADLLSVCLSTLVGLEHFNMFSAAEAMNKPSFMSTCRTESLHRLEQDAVIAAWKIASVRFMSEMKKQQDGGAAKEEEEEEEEDELPTRPQAILTAAQVEVETYVPHYIKSGDPAVDRQNIMAFPTAKKEIDSETAAWNGETQGNRRITFYDEAGKKNPKWTYVKGHNEWRCKIGFSKEPFEEAMDLWRVMAAPAEGEKKEKIDVFSVWNVDQAPASRAIKAKAATLTGVTTKKVSLKGLQKDVERRLWAGAPTSADHHLDGLPGVSEECYDMFAGLLPERKKHIHAFGPYLDNFYPEEIIPLRNPAKSEPLVTMAVKKQIFPPDFDEAAGSGCLRDDEVGTRST